MRKLVVVLFLFPLLLSSCVGFLESEDAKASKDNEKQIQAYLTANKLTLSKTTSGLYYTIDKTNPAGQNVEVGDEVLLDYTLSLLDGTVLDTATNAYLGFYSGEIIPGFLEGISLLREGEKGTFIMPSTLAFGGTAGANRPAWSVIKAQIEVQKFRNESEQINEYLAEKNLVVTETTASGLRFIRTQAVDASKPSLNTGDIVKVKYKGMFLNGAVFDPGTQPLQVTIGSANSLISGFTEAVKLLKIGEKGVAIMPSSIAYGKTGGGSIPPYTPIMFELEVAAAE